MNPAELIQLAKRVDLDNQDQFRLRIAFGVACVEHVEQLLTDTAVIQSLSVGKAFVAGKRNEGDLAKAAITASASARSHPGSSSLDGGGSAAVSTSFGVAAALEGRALEAAEYAAYASVYSYASHAVTDITAYQDEHAWQINKLRELVKGNEGQAQICT
jgi:hypothetical protein